MVMQSLTVIQRQRKQKNLAKLISMFELIGTVVKYDSYDTHSRLVILMRGPDFVWCVCGVVCGGVR